jgi:hypothetical protein
MNGLSTTLTVAAVGAGILAAASLWMGWVMERRVPPRVPHVDPVTATPPPDVVLWTGEAWTERGRA